MAPRLCDEIGVNNLAHFIVIIYYPYYKKMC